jgi:hypothetical protein
VGEGDGPVRNGNDARWWEAWEGYHYGAYELTTGEKIGEKDDAKQDVLKGDWIIAECGHLIDLEDVSSYVEVPLTATMVMIVCPACEKLAVG